MCHCYAVLTYNGTGVNVMRRSIDNGLYCETLVCTVELVTNGSDRLFALLVFSHLR